MCLSACVCVCGRGGGERGGYIYSLLTLIPPHHFPNISANVFFVFRDTPRTGLRYQHVIRGGLLYSGVKNHIFAAVYGFDQRFWRQRGLDVLGGVRQLPTIANFLAVCVNRSSSVEVSAEFFCVMAVSENPIIGPHMI